MPSTAIVRTPIRIAARVPPRRPLDERILLRMPALAWSFAALVLRLPHRSRIRSSLLAFLVRRGYAAAARGDLDVLMALMYDPAAELSFAGRVADFEQTYRGRDAAFAAYRSWVDTWDEYRREPIELADLGDRLLILLRESGRGKESGVAVETPLAMLLTFRGGRVVRHQEFRDWQQALEAVGVRE
jgi:ketosteroid isomerase-like protein